MAPSLRLVVALFVLCVCDGLVSLGSPATSGTRVRPSVKRQVRQEAVVSPAVALALAGPTMYGLMSFNEYVTHRYYQHAEFNRSPWLQAIAKTLLSPFSREVPVVKGGGHVEHHAETLDDMSLKTDEKWLNSPVAKVLDDDKYRGTAFSWTVSGLMLVQMLPTAIPVFTLALGFSLGQTLLFLLPSVLLHTLVWNALHPFMHALPDVPLADGPPSGFLAKLRSTPYFKFLYANHQGHHIVGGRGNYNVACPGADHLFGTFVPEKNWRPKMSTTFESYHGQAIPHEEQIKNHIANSAHFNQTLAMA